MLNKIEKSILFLLCVYSLFFFIGSTLAPILAHFSQYDVSAKLTGLYMNSCHQQPDRSFWILGYPIALCCRCYGFYMGVTASTIIAFFNKLNINWKLLLFLTSYAIIDTAINYIAKINTGNIERFITGIIMGFIFTTMLCYTTKFIKEKINYAH